MAQTAPPPVMVPLFPENEARKVLHWAEKAGNTALKKIVNEVRDWLGHPETLTDRKNAWSPSASGELTDALTALDDARGKLEGYWAGQAYHSYLGYLKDLEASTKETRTQLGKLATNLGQVRTEVNKAYMAAITFIGNSAAAILEAEGDLIGGIDITDPKSLITQVPSSILKLLADLLRELTSLQTKTMGILNNLQTAGENIKITISDLELAPQLPTIVGDEDSWHPHRRD